MSHSRIRLNYIEDAITRAVLVDPEHARAGGTVLLVTRLNDGRLLTVGSLDGPFYPFKNAEAQEVVEVEGFTVQVYTTEWSYQNQDAPILSGSITTGNLFALHDLIRDAAEKAREPRSYCIGLPVVITVHADGEVTYDVDLSEADDIDEGVPEAESGDPMYTDTEVAEDIDTVQRWLHNRLQVRA